MSNITMGAVIDRLPDERTYATGKNLVLSQCGVGLELELEDVPKPRKGQSLPNWKVISDGSLRGEHPSEFIFAYPLFGQDIENALDSIEEYITSNKYVPNLSARTSVHVHLDVRDLNQFQLKRLLHTYYSIERVLFKYVKPERENNIYCVPMYKSLQYKSNFKTLNAEDLENYPHVLSAFSKYSALNLAAILQKGSIEFRLHHGEWKKEPLLQWINIILSLKKYAIENDFGTEEIPDLYSSLGAEGYLESIFGSTLYSVLLYPDVDYDIMKCIRNLQEINYHLQLNQAHMEISRQAQTSINPVLVAHPLTAHLVTKAGQFKNTGYTTRSRLRDAGRSVSALGMRFPEFISPDADAADPSQDTSLEEILIDEFTTDEEISWRNTSPSNETHVLYITTYTYSEEEDDHIAAPEMRIEVPPGEDCVLDEEADVSVYALREVFWNTHEADIGVAPPPPPIRAADTLRYWQDQIRNQQQREMNEVDF